MKDGRIGDDEAKKYLKPTKIWRVIKLPTLNWCIGERKYRPEIDMDIDPTPDSNTY